mgnify:CR=1 FL=1
MSEARGDYDPRERDILCFIDQNGISAFNTRKKRFDNRVDEVNSGIERADAYFYTRKDLIDAYNDAEEKAAKMVEAFLEFKDSLHTITELRQDIMREHDEQEERRSLGSDVLDIAGISEPRNPDAA